MEAAAVVDLNLSRADFWSMTPREFAACFQRHSEREYRADRRFAFLASYVANYAGRALPDHKTISPDDILGVRAAPQDSFVERLKRELDPAQAAERYVQQLRLADPGAHVTMSKAVLDALARGRGTWTTLGTREGLTEPASVQAVMRGDRP